MWKSTLKGPRTGLHCEKEHKNTGHIKEKDLLGVLDNWKTADHLVHLLEHLATISSWYIENKAGF